MRWIRPVGSDPRSQMATNVVAWARTEATPWRHGGTIGSAAFSPRASGSTTSSSHPKWSIRWKWTFGGSFNSLRRRWRQRILRRGGWNSWLHCTSADRSPTDSVRSKHKFTGLIYTYRPLLEIGCVFLILTLDCQSQNVGFWRKKRRREHPRFRKWCRRYNNQCDYAEKHLHSRKWIWIFSVIHSAVTFLFVF